MSVPTAFPSDQDGTGSRRSSPKTAMSNILSRFLEPGGVFERSRCHRGWIGDGKGDRRPWGDPVTMRTKSKECSGDDICGPIATGLSCTYHQ